MLESTLSRWADPSAIYSPPNRKKFLIAGILSVIAIALLDAGTPNIPLGFLYFFPILLIAGFVSRKVLVAVALVCGFLTGRYSDYRLAEAVSVSLIAFIGFAGTGFLVSEIIRSRELVAEHQDEVRGLIESSPLAIVTVSLNGRIRLSNEAAQRLLAPGEPSISGRPIAEFLPSLQPVIQQHPSTAYRTELRCHGKRKNGESFLAGVWFSTSGLAHNPLLAAIIVDLSQDLRDREDQNLENLLTNARIILSSMAHEIRNLCGAALVTYRNLSRLDFLEKSEDFRALGSLVEALKALSAMELRSSDQPFPSVDLASVLDEFRIVTEPTFRGSQMTIVWPHQETFPPINGDHHGLLQVFLNLARNSHAAMEKTPRKQLTISVATAEDSVVVRFEDTGVGVEHPERLFRPFQEGAASTGLGLYVSRAILKSFGGKISYEPRPEGCCFAVVLHRADVEGCNTNRENFEKLY